MWRRIASRVALRVANLFRKVFLNLLITTLSLIVLWYVYAIITNQDDGFPDFVAVALLSLISVLLAFGTTEMWKWLTNRAGRVSS
jgi:hypothetical protein